MRGGIYPKGKCPVCGGKFIRAGNDFICPVHQTRPKRVYIKLYSKDLHKHISINSNSRREPFFSYEEAEPILTKIRAEIYAGSFDITRYVAQKLKPLQFTNWSEDWLTKKVAEVEKGDLAPSYLKTLKAHVRKHQQPFFQMKDIRDINPKLLDEFRLTLNQAPHYVQNILDTLENMLRDAYRWEEIGKVPEFPGVKIPESDITIIDLDEQDKIINAVKDPMDRAYLLFTAREMVRPCETRALQWPDLDLKHDRVKICRHFSLNRIRPATKGGQVKRLPLDSEVREALLALPRHISSPFVFWKGKQGKPFSESWARKIWKKTAKEMGFDISLYQGTRHSSATEAVDRVGLDVMQEFLHHASRKMTERYVKLNPDRLRKVVRK